MQPAKSAQPGLRQQHIFSPDTNDERIVRAALATLTQQAGYIMRRQKLGCRRLTLHLVYSDGTSITRQAAAKVVLSDDSALELHAAVLLDRAWKRRVRLRRIALACSQMCQPVHQLSLFSVIANTARQKNKRISEACDTIRNRCGSAKIYRGSQQPILTPRPA